MVWNPREGTRRSWGWGWAARVPRAAPTCPPQTTPCARRGRRHKSHVGEDPVHEEGHDSGAEQTSHGHSHKPGHKDVPEETPVHGLPGADPAHGHHRAHLWEHRHSKVKTEAREFKGEAQTLQSSHGKRLISEVNCIIKPPILAS